jgi:hypothetical protein
MVSAERDLHRSRRRVCAVRRSPTADRPWHHPEFAGDVVLAVLALYVTYVLVSMVVVLP